jgi:hypothetical protein
LSIIQCSREKSWVIKVLVVERRIKGTSSLKLRARLSWTIKEFAAI